MIARAHAIVLCALSLCLLSGCSGDPDRRAGSDRQVNAKQPAAKAGGAPREFPASFFTRRIPADAALDRESAAMARELRNMAYGVDPQATFDCGPAVAKQPDQWSAEEQANCSQLTTRAGIAFDEFAPAVYTVGKHKQRVPVAIDNPQPTLRRVMRRGVPIPAGAEPASGSDAQLVVWQPGTDTMWELWRARREADGWHAGYGGRIQNVSESPGHFRYVEHPTRPGYSEHHSWGGPSSSIPNLPGLIRLRELRRGEVDHALVFATWSNAPAEWVYPAQRTDGICRGPYCSQIPQGARFRLDPRFDTDSLSHPVVRMIAEAVQKYGMVLNNTTGGGVTFYAEAWRPHLAVDPYHGPGGYFSTDPTQVQPTLFMREFPWADLQMLKRGTTCRDRARQCPPPRWWPVRQPR